MKNCNLLFSILLLTLLCLTFSKLCFGFEIGFPLPFLSNIENQVFESLLIFFNFDFCYFFNNSLFLGLYMECMTGFYTLLDTIEAFFWVVLFPIHILFTLTEIWIWPFPEFKESMINIHAGLLIGYNLYRNENFAIDISLKLGLGYLFLWDGYEYLCLNILPNVKINFQKLLDGLGFSIGYDFIIPIIRDNSLEVVFYPYLSISF